MKTLMAGYLFFSVLYSCYLHSKLLLMSGLCNSLDFSTVNLWQFFLQNLSMCFCVSSVQNVWICTCIWNWLIWAIFWWSRPLTLSCLNWYPISVCGVSFVEQLWWVFYLLNQSVCMHIGVLIELQGSAIDILHFPMLVKWVQYFVELLLCGDAEYIGFYSFVFIIIYVLSEGIFCNLDI